MYFKNIQIIKNHTAQLLRQYALTPGFSMLDERGKYKTGSW
jgi:hypothetical protein